MKNYDTKEEKWQKKVNKMYFNTQHHRYTHRQTHTHIHALIPTNIPLSFHEMMIAEKKKTNQIQQGNESILFYDIYEYIFII